MLEDNSADAEIVVRLLRKENLHFETSLAMNKEAYMLALDKFEPDLILADNSLPQFSATEALRIARERLLLCPFIMVTGTVSEEFAASIIKLGADDYILKDRLNRLPAAIDAALKQRQSEKERLEAQQKLVESEERYRMLIERVSEAFIAIDKNWRFTYVNKKAGEMMGRDPESLIGKNVWEEFPDTHVPPMYKNFRVAMAGQRYTSNIDYDELLGIWRENHIYPSPDGISVFVRDITDKKKAEQELEETNMQLRNLSSHLQNIREEERMQIARDIHDELGQQLTGLKIDMYWLSKRLSTQDEAIIKKMSSTIELIDETIKSVRRISSNLRPSILDDLGLIAALEWHSQEVGKRSEIEINFSSDGVKFDVPVAITTAVFRVYQEILTNAIRHANANTITSDLKIKDNQLMMEVKDDGQGMDLTKISSKKTLGLIGMKERVYALGGKFELKSKPGKGTQIKISIPV